MTAHEMVKTALEIKDLFRDISSFFEKHTSMVCPSCGTVCCLSRHGYYRDDDIAFLSALGTDLPRFDREERTFGSLQFSDGNWLCT